MDTEDAEFCSEVEIRDPFISTSEREIVSFFACPKIGKTQN